MTLVVKKMKRTEQKTKWWKLEKGRVVFKEGLRQALAGREVLPDGWMTIADVIRRTSGRVLGVSSGKTDFYTGCRDVKDVQQVRVI